MYSYPPLFPKLLYNDSVTRDTTTTIPRPSLTPIPTVHRLSSTVTVTTTNSTLYIKYHFHQNYRHLLLRHRQVNKMI